MSEFSWVDETTLYQGVIIALSQVTVADPEGRHHQRDVVHHPGAVAVVPLHADGTVTLVRQYRTPLQDDLLEIPAGKRDIPGEPAEVTAERELAEEVGLRAGHLVQVAEFYNSAGFSDELSHVFLATDLTHVPNEAQGVEEEHMTVERLALAEAPALVADGRLCDAKTIIGLLAVLRLVESGAVPGHRSGGAADPPSG